MQRHRAKRALNRPLQLAANRIPKTKIVRRREYRQGIEYRDERDANNEQNSSQLAGCIAEEPVPSAPTDPSNTLTNTNASHDLQLPLVRQQVLELKISSGCQHLQPMEALRRELPGGL